MGEAIVGIVPAGHGFITVVMQLGRKRQCEQEWQARSHKGFHAGSTNRREEGYAKSANLIPGRLVDEVDHQYFRWTLSRFEPWAELLLQRCDLRWRDRVEGMVRRAHSRIKS